MDVSSLGFKMQNRGKRTCAVVLNKKHDDPRVMLSLAHYTQPLSSVLILEAFMARVIKEHFKGNQSSPLPVKELIDQTTSYTKMFQKEHMKTT